MSLTGALARMRGRGLSARELLAACRARVERHEPEIRAFVTPTFELAEKAAEEADRRYARGDNRALDGVPVGVKDQFETSGVRTTSGSRSLIENVPGDDATAWQRLSEAGAGLLGKLTMSEWGMGTSTAPTRNPWDTRKNPGGSSGGSAAAVAARFTPLALGADAGGSVRTPAALCGCVGLKPTHGLIPRHGLLGGESSFGDVGTLTRTVADASLALGLLAGHDPLDPDSLDMDVPEYPREALGSLEGRRIGVPFPLLWEGTEASIEREARRGVALLEELGAEVVEVELPESFRAFAAPTPEMAETDPALGLLLGYPLTMIGVEAAAYHYHLHRQQPGSYSPEVRGLLRAAERMSAAEWLRAGRLRERFTRELREVFERERLDAMVHPTMKEPPADQDDHGPLDEEPRQRTRRDHARDLLASRMAPVALGALGRKRVASFASRYASGALESLGVSAAPGAGAEVWNACGFPSVSVPVGLDSGGIPVGLLINGPPLTEPALLEIGLALEEAAGFTDLSVPLEESYSR